MLIVNRNNEYKSAIIAFVASENPLIALTEEYLLTQPRIATLDIERFLSFKEDRDVNAAVSKWLAKIDWSKEDIAKALGWVETLVTSIWLFRDSPSIKTTHMEHGNPIIAVP